MWANKLEKKLLQRSLLNRLYGSKCTCAQLWKNVNSRVVRPQWRIQKFKNREARSRRGIVFGDCFDAPSHIPYAFVVRVENKIHIETLHVDYNKAFVCYGVKITKITPIKNFKQGGVRPARRRWIRLWSHCSSPSDFLYTFSWKESLYMYIMEHTAYVLRWNRGKNLYFISHI